MKTGHRLLKPKRKLNRKLKPKSKLPKSDYKIEIIGSVAIITVTALFLMAMSPNMLKNYYQYRLYSTAMKEGIKSGQSFTIGPANDE